MNLSPASKECFPEASKSTKKIAVTATDSLYNSSRNTFAPFVWTVNFSYPNLFLTTSSNSTKMVWKKTQAGSHHSMVEYSILQRRVMIVLTVQVFANHLNVSLLTHLFWRFHAKTDVASRIGNCTCVYAEILIKTDMHTHTCLKAIQRRPSWFTI